MLRLVSSTTRCIWGAAVLGAALVACSDKNEPSPGGSAGSPSAGQAGGLAGAVSSGGMGQAGAGGFSGMAPSRGGASGSGMGGASSGSGGAGAGSAGLSGSAGSSGADGTSGASGIGGASGVSGGGAGNGSGGTQAGAGASGGGTGGAASADATIVPDPSWDCGMPEGVPPPTQGEPVFSATLELGAVHEFGETQYGDRRLLDVTGGTFSGDRISGMLLTGGLDLELTLSNGAVELEQINLLRTSDNQLIYLRTCGFAPNGDSTVRAVFDFEAPNSSSHAWLNEGKYAGVRVVDEEAGTIQLTVYDVSDVLPSQPEIRLTDPADALDQPWDCATNTGARGDSVFTETVTLGGSISVGARKHGTRNIIPITGGTITGRVMGTVLPGGADYQLASGTTVLDARYTLSSSDGEFILVRNCGPFGALVPLFEARAEGPYAFLNANDFLSSDPGGAQGGVSITFYEAR